MLQGFSLYGEPDAGGDFDERTRKRRLAEALMMQGSDTSPVRSWTQGAARLAQALVGGYESGKYDREQKAADGPIRAAMDEYRKSLTGQSGSAPMSLASAGPAAGGGAAPRPASFSGSQGDFVQAMLPHAMKVAEQTGLDPRLVIAQSALETGYGRSAPGNNFFGIKSHGKPGGNTLATTEVVNGQPVQTRDSFRSYGDKGESAADYAAFLQSNPRYRDVLGAQGLDAQIEAMARSGYATDPMYGNKLRQIAGGIQLPQSSPAPVQTASLDGLPPGPVASDAPPMAFAPGQQAISAAMPQTGPTPPQRPAGQQLVQNFQTPAPPPPQATGNPGAALLAAAMSPGVSPRLQEQAMQMYQLTQREQPKWEKLNDGTLYNPRTAETRNVGGGFRPLTDPAERARFGIAPDDRTPYFLGPDGKPAALGRAQTNVNIDNKPESAADTEAAKALIKRNVAALDAADKAQAAMGDINTMREISRRVGSAGSTANIKAAIGPYAEAFGINIEGLPDIQAFEAVIQRMAPQMRAEGSGSTSDIEFKGMLASLPRLSSNPQAREMILDTMEANARYNIMRGEIALKVLTKEITRADGEKQMRALGDPMAAFKEFRKQNPELFSGRAPTPTQQQQGQSAPVRRRYDAQGNLQ